MPSAPRAPLNRPRVLRAAIDLADTDGLDAVTMRRLADHLGVVPMALYKHVATKEDLLDGMVDTLIGDMHGEAAGAGQPGRDAAGPALPHEAGPDWRVEVHALAHRARLVVTGHPWARRAIESRTRRTTAVLAHMERVSQVFLRAGFSPDLTHHVMHLLGNRIWGFSPELFTGDPPATASATAGRRAAAPPDPADYPGILAITADAQARRPGAGCDEDFEFEFALDVILDGVARLHGAGWSSPT